MYDYNRNIFKTMFRETVFQALLCGRPNVPQYGSRPSVRLSANRERKAIDFPSVL